MSACKKIEVSDDEKDYLENWLQVAKINYI